MLRDSALLDPGQDLAGEDIAVLLEHHHVAVAVDSVIAEVSQKARRHAKKCRIGGHFPAGPLPRIRLRKHIGSNQKRQRPRREWFTPAEAAMLPIRR